MVSDAAVRLGVTLVSGAAIGWTGQWGVYGGRHQENRDDEAEDKEEGHDTGEWKVDGWLSSTPRMKTNLSAHGQRDTKDDIPKSTRTQTLKAEKLRRPCYRCLWPQPILSSSSRQGAGTCEEEGVLGPTVGLVGVSMAAEAIKVLIGLDEPTPKLTMMNIQGGGVTPFRSVKLRGRRADCVACGDEPKLTDDLEKMDYETFCSGAQAPAKSGASDKVAGKEDPVERISAKQFGEIVSDSKRRSRVLVVDVRQKTEYGIAALPGTISKFTPVFRVLGFFFSSLSSLAAWEHEEKEQSRSLIFFLIAAVVAPRCSDGFLPQIPCRNNILHPLASVRP